MDKDKSRGRNHIKNKTKYKPKGYKKPALQDNVKDLVTVTSEPNNWDRYEEPEEDEHLQQSGSDLTNFSKLAQAPISHGGHFQFKSDKNVQLQSELHSFNKNELFSLNLNLVSFSLTTIPFTRRCSLDESYLKQEQLDEIDNRALQNGIEYENFLKIRTSISSTDAKISKKNDVEDLNSILQGLEDCDLDEGCVNLTNVTRKVAPDEEDLELWLDDILDD